MACQLSQHRTASQHNDHECRSRCNCGIYRASTRKANVMKTSRILIAAATLAALGGAFTAASARDLSASADVARDTVKGHAYQNGGVSKEQVADMDHHLKPYD